MEKFLSLIKEDEGASMAEYALLLGLITVAIATVITAFGGQIQAVFQRATTAIQ